MQYIHPATLAIYSLSELRSVHPQVSMPEGADLSDLGYAVLLETEPPATQEWQIAEPGAPVDDNGWRTTWLVREMTPAEKSERAALLIDQIERDSLIPRIVREATIYQLEAYAASKGYPLPAFRAANKGYRLLKEADEYITTLRGYIL